jgi:hypothetical protein
LHFLHQPPSSATRYSQRSLELYTGFLPNQTQNHTFLQTFFSTTQIFPTGTPLNSEACNYSMEK